jgi:hypothetical protein
LQAIEVESIAAPVYREAAHAGKCAVAQCILPSLCLEKKDERQHQGSYLPSYFSSAATLM